MNTPNEEPTTSNSESAHPNYILDSLKAISSQRGTFIHLSTVIEAILEAIIMRHFLGYNEKKKNDFRYAILSKENFNFQFKVTAVSYIIDNYYPEINSGKVSLSSLLNKMVEKRNDFAHRKFKFDNPINKKELGKYYFEKESTKRGKPYIKLIEVSEQTMEEDINIIETIIKELTKFAELMNKKKNLCILHYQ